MRDGSLARCEAVKVHIDRDGGYRPEQGHLDREGENVEDRIYNVRDLEFALNPWAGWQKKSRWNLLFRSLTARN